MSQNPLDTGYISRVIKHGLKMTDKRLRDTLIIDAKLNLNSLSRTFTTRNNTGYDRLVYPRGNL